MPQVDGDVRRLFDLLEELIDAVQERDPHRQSRKLETVKEKVRRDRPSV
ncbi:MAG TPA: hypothetical protein VGX68_26960 [Thermoanaerobaculia bacterium]|jgi:replication-associated recombination protein RarA|nr:hypothetical protein [Thermoanaerobaculia bacterium]